MRDSRQQQTQAGVRACGAAPQTGGAWRVSRRRRLGGAGRRARQQQRALPGRRWLHGRGAWVRAFSQPRRQAADPTFTVSNAILRVRAPTPRLRSSLPVLQPGSGGGREGLGAASLPPALERPGGGGAHQKVARSGKEVPVVLSVRTAMPAAAAAAPWDGARAGRRGRGVGAARAGLRAGRSTQPRGRWLQARWEGRRAGSDAEKGAPFCGARRAVGGQSLFRPAPAKALCSVGGHCVTGM